MAAPATQSGNSGVSPSSSPRLPSPPPFTEVQFGPKSPSIGGGIGDFSLDPKIDDGASRRIRPGTKAADMAKGPEFVPLHKVESAFQLQEYLQALYGKLTRGETGTVKPVDKEMALELATPPTQQDTGEDIERNLWLYELCRFLCNKTSRIIVAFFMDNPPCSSQTCPEMRASEWQYLCAVHEPPKSCCAIDYCNHTLDWASNILSSNKHFPSRLALGGEGGNAYQSMRQLTNIFRRVYRIYAHAWFQHREVFWAIEAELGLYMFFKTVCDQYQLIPEDNYTIPPEAEGAPEEKEETAASASSPEKVSNISILQKNDVSEPGAESTTTNTVTTGATTRRHKHTPSTGVPIAVIAEGQEDEEEETTILDLGAPGPAQESNSSLSPPKARIERAKSPGLIAIPDIIDPERAPEDPTPIAVQESDPFEFAARPETPEKISFTSPIAEAVDASILHDPSEKTAESTMDNTIPAPSILSVVENPETLSSVLGHLEDMDNPKALDSDTETQIAIEDTKTEQSQDDENEAMDKIDISEIKDKPTEDTKVVTEKLPEVKTEPTESDTKEGVK